MDIGILNVLAKQGKLKLYTEKVMKSKPLAQNLRKIWEQDAPDTGVIRYADLT